MPLTKRDIERIKSIGFHEDYFIDKRSRMPKLKNVNGHCVFLDPETNACAIYPDRPEGCRLYPLVYDPERNEVVVDELCPKSHTVPRGLVRRLRGALLSLIDRLSRDYA